MKLNILIISVLALATTTVAKASETTDTIATDTVVEVLNPHKIIITERSDGGISLEVKGSGNNSKFRYNYSTRQERNAVAGDSIDDFKIPFLSSLSGRKNTSQKKVSVEWFESIGMYYGFTAMSGAGDLGNMGSSAEFGLLNPLSMSIVFPHSWRIDTGVGFGWKNYRMDSNNRFVKDDDGRLAIAGYEPDTYSHLSRLKIFCLDVPVIARKNFGGLSLCAGAVLDFNVYGSMLTRYRQNEKEIKISEKGINQRKVTVDFVAALQYYDVGIYVKYNPSTVLKSGNLPEFRSFSIGFCVGM